MKNSYLLSLLIITLFLTGCTTIKSEIPEISQNINFYVDEFNDHNSFVRIRGWVQNDNANPEDLHTFIILKNKETSKTYETLKEERQDVAGKTNVLGFQFSINKNYLQSGTYHVQILVKNDDSKVMQDTYLTVNVDKNLVSPFSKDVKWAESYYLGDSKLMDHGNDIVTFSTNGALIMKKNEQSFKDFSPAIPANWFGMEKINKENVVLISSSFAKTNIEVYEINLESRKSKHLSTVSNDGKLKIDPTILKTDKGYYATFTEITGNVNRSNPNQENGLYETKLYFSINLKEWNFVNTIINKSNNLEDGNLLLDRDHNLRYLYEEEELDKGHSQIKMVTSTNQGKDWSEPEILLGEPADHELAEIIHKDNSYYLFYSSDIDHGGTGSYDFAKMKYAVLDEQFHIVKKNIDIDGHESAVLYDVLQKENSLYYLYTKDYSTENQLVLFKHNSLLIRLSKKPNL